MKFLVDAQLPPALARWLVAQGHLADHVYDLELTSAPDILLAQKAETENYILISKDEDFLHLRLPGRFQFLWLRCGNTTSRGLLAWIEPRWAQTLQLLILGEGLVELR